MAPAPPRASSSTTSTLSHERILPVLRDRPAVGDPRDPWAGTVHAEEPPVVHAGVGGDAAAVGRGVQAHGHLRPVQRPAHAAVVRQPAGRRVPPDAGRSPIDSIERPTSCSTSTRQRATGSPPPSAPPTSCARRSPTSASPAPSRRAAPRASTSSCRSSDGWRWRTPRRRRGRSPGAPSSSTRRSPRRRSSRPIAAARCSSTPRAPAGRRSSPPTAHGPGRASRCRSPWHWDELDDVGPADFTIQHGARPPRRPAIRGPSAMPRPAARPGRPRRRGPRDPRRPRRRDARGQAPQACGQARRPDAPSVPWNARATG